MASVRFVLKEPQKSIKKSEQKETLVLMLLNYDNQRLKLSTKKHIHPEFWNETDQKAKSVKQFSHHQNFNARLNQYRKAGNDAYDELILKGVVPTKEKLKHEIFQKLEINGHTSSKISLNEYIEKYIKDIESGSHLTEHKTRYKYNTIRSVKDFNNQFFLYQRERRRNLNFEDITLDFYDDFTLHFTNKDNSPGTIGRLIKILKSVMRCARDEGLHSNMEIEKKKFKTIKSASEQIYLTEEEIEKIYSADLSERPALGIARDLFMIGYYSAQRFSDFSRIEEANIKRLNGDNKVIEIIQNKTGEKVSIPIHHRLKELLEKYEYMMPQIPVQKLNQRIKIVGEKAGIAYLVYKETTKGGVSTKVSIPKCKLISTHTARRSAATNMYLAGIPSIDIMKITGHKTEREFLKYIKVSKDETAALLANHGYFKKEIFDPRIEKYILSHEEIATLKKLATKSFEHD